MGRFGERYMTEQNWKIIGDLEAFAGDRGHTLLDLAFSWLVSRPFLTSVIAGATRPEQIDANVKAASWKLTADEVKEIDKLTRKP
jgi:aryl-alcohol dehydrogenase-like predicted oxidoreductase